MPCDLTVITVVENDRGLINYMIDSVFAFTNPHPDIIICHNGGSDGYLDRYSDDPRITVVDHTPELDGGSNRHGESLNKILPLVKTKKTAIIESDCVLLSDEWHKLDLSKYKLKAAKKGELIGHIYYWIFFLVFETETFRNMDFMPGFPASRKNRGYYIHEDAGWRIKDTVNKEQIQLIDFLDTKDGYGQFFDGSFCSDELIQDGKAIIAHFGRGSNPDKKTRRKGFDPTHIQLDRWKALSRKIIDDRNRY